MFGAFYTIFRAWSWGQVGPESGQKPILKLRFYLIEVPVSFHFGLKRSWAGADLASIHAAFDKVDAAVAQAFTKVVSGPEALVVGLSDATGMVEDTLGPRTL